MPASLRSQERGSWFAKGDQTLASSATAELEAALASEGAHNR
jgi:lipid A disaccharide synthetase